MEKQILGADDPKNRDLSVVKTCRHCGRLYHPRKNSYKTISTYCSQDCFRKALRSKTLE